MTGDTWSTAIKQAVGTSYESYDSDTGYSSRSATAPISRVWFTAAQGVLTETFWPTVDTPQVKDSQFLITTADGQFIEERKDLRTQVEWIQVGVPAYRITNTDPQGRFVIEKTIFTDPDRDTVIQRIRIQKNVAGLNFYVLHNPSVANSPFGDSARVSSGTGGALMAWQTTQAQALLSSVPYSEVTAGFVGASSDGWKDLQDHRKLDSNFETATDGNVVMTGHIGIGTDAGESRFDLALGFGNDAQAAYGTAQATLAQDLNITLQRFSSQWSDYQKGLHDLTGASHDQGVLFRSSVALIKSMEDKTHAGAFVASPTHPWGGHAYDTSAIAPGDARGNGAVVGGYHLVWPRDLYQMATAFLAVEDTSSALASLRYLRWIQYTGSADAKLGLYKYGSRQHSREGAFPQNTWVNGDAYWSGLQMDEVAMPIVLAYKLWQRNAIQPTEYWDMVRRAADFIQDVGPWSAQERWEETFGASPSTIAAEITGLWAAAEFADQMGDTGRAQSYRQHADAWSMKPGDNVDAWTFTQSGSYGNGRYFTRVEGAASYDQTWNPNDDQRFTMANGAGTWREKDVMDGGFLELVRFGVRSPLDPHIVDTIPTYDAVVGTMIEGHGQGYIRYNGDRYNYDDVSGAQTAGAPWPLLTGERGHYELGRAVALGRTDAEIVAAVDPYVRTIESVATPGKMIPEQVWPNGPRAGQSTGSATPLGWSHGEYLKLLRSKSDRQIFDRLPLAVRRQAMLEAMSPAERAAILR